VLDAWPRRCIGWQLSRTIDTQLTLAALNQTIALRLLEAGLIHHSDRGIQYASSAAMTFRTGRVRRSVGSPD
jgi:transposase InsO family protein